jgi:phage shock protein E
MWPTRAVGAVLVLGCACATPSVTGASAEALVQLGATLVDVRSPEEFAAGHLPGALNEPVAQLADRLAQFPVQRDHDVVVYCRSGHRSAQAAAILKQAGFTKVHDLGAMSNWKSATD